MLPLSLMWASLPLPRQVDGKAIAIMVLAGVLVGGLAVYNRSHWLFSRRMHRAEHLHEIVRGLLDTPASSGEGWIASTLERLARSLKADNAWLLIGVEPASGWTWSSDGAFSPDEAEAVTQTATMRFPWRDDRILVAPGQLMEIVDDRAGRRRRSLKIDTLLLRSSLQGEVVLLGLSGRRPLRVRPEMGHAVTAVFGAVVQTLSRHLTERRQSQEERDAAIGRRMETIGTFASGMAHNLNNIIAAIAGFNAITEMHVAPNSVVSRSVTDIDISVRRAQAIVREVLSFGRRLERTSPTVDLIELLSETAAMLVVSLPKRVNLQTDEPAEQWAVLGDFGQLQQVLLNICNNAAQAMLAGGTIRLEIRHLILKDARRLSHSSIAPGPYVAISIHDQGLGMSPAVAAKIFDPFFTTRAGGTGLGLSTARDIMKQHGGTIDVHSVPGQGSEFTIWLPATTAQVSAVDGQGPTGNGEVVLIVNADQARLMVDEELVAALGYEPSGLADVRAIEDFEGYINIILIAGTDEGSVAAALESVRETGWSMPILVATVEPMVNTPGPRLSYPLQPMEIAGALASALAPAEQPRLPALLPTGFLPAALSPRRPAIQHVWLPLAVALLGTALTTGASLSLRTWRTDAVASAVQHRQVVALSRRIGSGPVLPLSAPQEDIERITSASDANASLDPDQPASGGTTFQMARPNGRTDASALQHLPLASLQPTTASYRSRPPRDRAAANVRLIEASFFHQRKPTACRVYVGRRWKLIGIVGASDCIQLGFASRKTTYLQLGSNLLSQYNSRIFVWRRSSWRPLVSGSMQPAAPAKIFPELAAVLSLAPAVVCRRFDGATWRRVGILPIQHCVERAFAQPGTGFVQSGTVLLSRRAGRIGITRGAVWQAVARVADSKTAGEPVTLRAL